MSFDRPGIPHPGRPGNEPDIDDLFREEGVELDQDGDLEGLDHPGTRSAGPQPNPPRRPLHEQPRREEPLPEEAPSPEN